MNTDLMLRVSKQNRCPICEKPDWCLVSADGETAICARVQSDHKVGEAGWLHKLSDPRPAIPAPAPVKQSPMAPPSVRDATYRALLRELSLSEAHRLNLLARGLTDDHIHGLGYRTLPTEGRRTLSHGLAQRGVTLAGVPGFWFEEHHPRLSGPAGILIPVRNTSGQIVGLQVRCDNAEGGKYKWVSSATKDGGCSPGAPVHIARPSGTQSTDIWITEGPLKADIAAIRLGNIVLAVAGVSNWRGVVPILQELQPSRVVVAYDADKATNYTVATYERLLVFALLRLKFNVYTANWPTKHKGIDDALVAGVSL